MTNEFNEVRSTPDKDGLHERLLACVWGQDGDFRSTARGASGLSIAIDGQVPSATRLGLGTFDAPATILDSQNNPRPGTDNQGQLSEQQIASLAQDIADGKWTDQTRATLTQLFDGISATEGMTPREAREKLKDIQSRINDALHKQNSQYELRLVTIAPFDPNFPDRPPDHADYYMFIEGPNNPSLQEMNAQFIQDFRRVRSDEFGISFFPINADPKMRPIAVKLGTIRPRAPIT